MSDLFTYRDSVEGKIGIGRLPDTIISLLDDIANEYNTEIPNHDASTYHTWYDDMSPSIKQNVTRAQDDPFWKKLCDGSESCTIKSAREMDELYYSNPKNNMASKNMYGASGNYDIHRDCVFNFNGIKFYRVLIGLTNGNDNIITQFTNLDVGHKLNKGDYIVFDFDRSTHQVIKERQELTPRILLKLHYIVCENCTHSAEYVETMKKIYLYYEFIFRYIMQTGTDPETYYQFFMGILCQYFMSSYAPYVATLLLGLIVVTLRYGFKIKLFSSLAKYTVLSSIGLYLSVVLFYWARYQLAGIR